jgi:hypothetical protein
VKASRQFLHKCSPMHFERESGALEQNQGRSEVSEIRDVGFFLRKKPDGSCGLPLQ